MRRARSSWHAPTAAVIGLALLGIHPAVAADGGAGSATSLNRAGYTVITGSVRRTSAWLVQPQATCGHGASYADFRISFARAGRPVEAGTAADCHAGRPSYYAWTNFGGQRERLDSPVAPGDSLEVVLIRRPHGMEVDVTNYTQGWVEGYGIGRAGDMPRLTRATFGVVARTADSGVLPLTNFGTMTFRRCAVNRERIGQLDAQPVVMKTSTGVGKAEPTSLRRDFAFDVTWTHA